MFGHSMFVVFEVHSMTTTQTCLFIYFFAIRLQIHTQQQIPSSCTYYILQVGFHSRVVPRRKRRDQNSFCNQNKLTLVVVLCFGRLCIVHMSMLKDTTSANCKPWTYTIYYIGPPILKRSFSFVCTGPFHSEVSRVWFS